MSSLINTNKAYLTPNEVAELLMVSPVTVRSWAQKGLLVAKVTPGGHRRFLKSEVERFARESGVTQAEAKASATRVLIVDDDLLTTSYVHDILEDSGLGFEIEIAHNGFEAGVKIHTFAPDVMFLNFMLPLMDGCQICTLIKADAATKHISVISITEDMSTEHVARILEAGAESFLAKPFNPQDLMGILSHTASVGKMLEAARIESSSKPKLLPNEPDNADTFLSSLTRIAENKNSFLSQHDATRLAAMVDIFGRSLGCLNPEQMLALRNACALHDIGNLGIPDSILLKPAPLTEEEWTVMRSHTLIGAQLCSGLKEMALTVPIIRSHHERWDGSGYPDGLAGEDIPFLARVFQIVDIFDALSSPRPYKAALSVEEVIGILRQEIANGWLDPDLGAVFLKLLNTRPHDFEISRSARNQGKNYPEKFI